MFGPGAETDSIGRSAAATLVVLLHALLIGAFLTLHLKKPADLPQREIEIGLLSLAKPAPHPAPENPTRKDKKRNLAPIERTIRALANAPSAPTALSGVGAMLNCNTPMSVLPASGQSACAHPGWRYNPRDAPSFTLGGPPPAHKWSQPEIDRYVLRTADPCLADRMAHVPCVHTIISGPVTIPDPSKTQDSGLSIGGFDILDGH